MRLQARQFDAGPAGRVSAVVAHPGDRPPGAVPGVILAHGAGNDMTHPLLVAVHEGVARGGYLSVRFNFPYTERHGRRPDPARVLEACYGNVIAAVRSEPALRPRRLVIGGKSLGGRIASQVAARGVPVDGLVFLGYPLHPAGKPDQLRVQHLAAIRAPMLFFAGTRDPLCPLARLRETLAALGAPTTLHVIEDGDHSFGVLKRTGRDRDSVHAEIVAVLVRWLRSVVP